MNISVVIPNYNGEELLRKNLPKVIDVFKDYQDGNVEIIVVDDASTDSSLSVISNFQSQIFPIASGSRMKTIIETNFKLLRNEKNQGFSPAVNRGVKEAKGEVVILLNTDVVPEKGFYIPLLENFSEKSVFAVGCMDKSVEGDEVVLRGRGVGEWKRGFLVHRKGEMDKKNSLWASGGSSAFRKSVWEKLSGLNEIYSPFYWEDIDISYRGLKSGYKIIFESKSIVVHEHEKGAIKKKYSPFAIRCIAYRNQFLFSWCVLTDVDLIFAHIFWLPYHFLKATLRGDASFFIGFFHAFLKIKNSIQSNIEARKLYIKSDKQVIKENHI